MGKKESPLTAKSASRCNRTSDKGRFDKKISEHWKYGKSSGKKIDKLENK
jgi:hypothetical protein